MEFCTDEMKVLLELTRLDFETLGSDAVNSLRKMNWNEFLQLAVKQKVILIVEKNLNIFVENHPLVDISQVHLMKLKLFSKRLRDHLEAINNEIDLLYQKFKQNYLKVVLFKGASMKQIYADEYLRCYNDIDLLIDLDDVGKTHDLLLRQQYFFCAVQNIDGKILQKKSRQVYNCIGNYSKTSNGITLNIDLHKADRYNTWNLLDFYKDSVKEANGIEHFNILDGFIFSCYHAWHHYPRVVNIRLGVYQASLKDYMDIRESYLYIRRKGLLDDLYRRIKMLQCEAIINNMLYLTERMYGTFCDRSDVITCEATVENDHMDSQLTSYFERRLFYPDQERELLKEYYASRNIAPAIDEFLESFYFDKEIYGEYSNERFWESKISYQSLEDIFYDEPYGTAIRKNRDFGFCFSLGWNSWDLIIRIEIFDKNPFWGQEDFYNPVQDCIKFIFNDDWSKVFTLQIKSKGSPVMFIDTGDAINLEKVKESMTYLKLREGGYSVVTNIPWKDTGFIPMKGEKIYFYFNFIQQSREMHCTNTIVFNDKNHRLMELK